MTPILVDSNLILDVAYEDPHWRAWSEAAIEQAAEQAALVINPIIFAEVSIGYARVEHVEGCAACGSVPERSVAIRGRISHRQVVLGVPSAWRNANLAARRFLHRRPLSGAWLPVADA